MKIKSINLSWVTVSDSQKAKDFFTKLGLKLTTETPEYGWMEFMGHEGGCRLGVGVPMQDSPEKPGDNAVVTFEVEDILKAKEELKANKVTILGDIIEVPGHVKLLTFTDPFNNKYQLCQVL